ncbi:hypothetical protein ACSDQ9_02890 [Aestuariimicrobium soli]|uniref:hypothetical protein n=1 Tax=Aestuariimicrobium soli TaxID=2035834 RepID=UPI003EB6CC52
MPLTVTVPSGTPEGDYVVAVVASSRALSWKAVTHVLVARHADFDTGTDDEAPWLFDNHGSGSNGPKNRFADGEAHYTWRFPLPADTTGAKLDLHINNQFVVQVSSDNATWTTVLRETEQIRDASNDAVRTLDLTPYLAATDGTTPRTVYVKVSDAFPDDGWGGQTSHVTVTPTP